jgi:hypothetical protein
MAKGHAMMKVPKRLHEQPTSARYWLTLIYEVGPRVTEAIRRENPYAWTFR